MSQKFHINLTKMARIHDLTLDQQALVLLLRHEFGYSYREIVLKNKDVLDNCSQNH